MRVTFWGVRGSFPVPGPGTTRYGGNTACVSVEAEGAPLIILDAGTGIRPLGKRLMKAEFGGGKGLAHLLISHTHWDHVQGFPFFQPIYVPGNELHLWGMQREDSHLRAMFRDTLHEENYFPVPFDSLKGQIVFHEVPEGEAFTIGPAQVSTVRLNHPWLACGYRVQVGAASVCYITDTAPFSDFLLDREFIRFKPQGVEDMETAQVLWSAHAALVSTVRDASVLVYDTLFTKEEFEAHPHWGHGTAADAIQLAREAGAGMVVPFHHAPHRDDEAMDAFAADARALAAAGGASPRVVVAYEGLVLDIDEKTAGVPVKVSPAAEPPPARRDGAAASGGGA
ncbi:MAG TPA: MBL fold metallo-hydrolase [Myxococcota bacterium]|jgi:phosphoribosyl 1,2-cyclic phosphodiesterase|nr:MBL fold metallo-hydrolase [Myxococcota bacterium]